MRSEDRYDSLLQWHCQAHGMDWRLAKAQMLVESAANPTAVSPVGARGLFQFMRRTWAEWWNGTPGIQGEPPAGAIDNPEMQIERRCDYMAWLLTQLSGDLEQALAAYNWGIGNVTRAVKDWGPLWSTVAPRETRDYLARIRVRYAALGATLEAPGRGATAQRGEA